MSRIVLVCAQAAGGVRSHLAQCARLLSASHTVTVVAPPTVLEGLDIGQAYPEPLAMGSRPSLHDPLTLSALRRAIRHAVPDVVHAHGLRAGALTALALARHTPRYVVTVHNMPVGSLLTREIGQVLMRIISQRADVVMAVSPDLRQWAQRSGAMVSRLATIPAPDGDDSVVASSSQVTNLRHELLSQARWCSVVPEHSDEASRDSSTSPSPLIITTVARLACQKGINELLDAARILQRLSPVPFVWAIAGDGPERGRVQRAHDEENLPVLVLGHRSDVSTVMLASDLIVSTSLWEGQPLTIQEALRAGKPLIATDVGGTALTARGGAILCPPHGQALAQAILPVLTSQTMRQQAEQRARDAAVNLPTQTDLADELSSVLGLEVS